MNATTLEAAAAAMASPWMTVEQVQRYLHMPSLGATRKWMQRHGVRKCKTDRRLTCQAWIDQALEGKGASRQPEFLSAHPHQPKILKKQS